MKDLIEALTIFAKYIPNVVAHPTHCEHDELFVLCDPALVSEDDLARLEQLSFSPRGRDASFRSFRFGSA
jgi:hypothetical protein